MIAITSCNSSTSHTEKSYINLRHTKNTALFTCRADKKTAATWRANNSKLDGTGEWVVRGGFRNKDIKELAQEFCEKNY